MVKPWDTATIGDFLDFKNGLNKGKEFFGYGTPIVNYTDVYRKRGLTKSDVRGKVMLSLWPVLCIQHADTMKFSNAKVSGNVRLFLLIRRKPVI